MCATSVLPRVPAGVVVLFCHSNIRQPAYKNLSCVKLAATFCFRNEDHSSYLCAVVDSTGCTASGCISYERVDSKTAYI